MRLINTVTLQVREPDPTKERVKFAILSHTWEKEEVSLQAIQSLDQARQLKGFRKIQKACERARSDGLSYLWVDTCCINRDSTAELSEAINSMYRWYQSSEICYAYLSDVHQLRLHDMSRSKASVRWFTRGWTLQELLAPSKVLFFNSSWEELGTKHDLAPILSEKTGIDCSMLRGGDILERSIAQRMSWAAGRSTTRPEDIAYCLLGIFDTNMPLLYGEGGKAFLRLQEEIIKHNDDHSIFAWSMFPPPASPPAGLLASSPDCFRDRSLTASSSPPQGRMASATTNRALSISLEITPWAADTYLAFLDSKHREFGRSFRIGIFLRRLYEDDQFARLNLGGEGGLHLDREYVYDACYRQNEPRPMEIRQIFIRNYSKFPRCLQNLADRNPECRVPLYSPSESSIEGSLAKQEDQSIRLQYPWSLPVLKLHGDSDFQYVAFGFDFDFNPVCLLADSPDRGGARETNASIEATSSYNDFPFNDIVEGDRAYCQEEHAGIWYLKGDRRWGLDVLLSRSLQGNGPIVRLQRIQHCRDRWEMQLEQG